MKISTNMRYDTLAKVAGWLLLLESILLLLPVAICLLYGESDRKGFLIAAAAAAVSGGLLTYLFRDAGTRLYRREGYFLISSVWVLFSIVGMIPFMIAETPLSATDAFFEAMSGFTTTGASVIPDVEAQSHGILLWRGLMQWIGGLGIVLFLIALLPSLNDSGGISLFNAEITGITHDKLHPQIRRTAASLWKTYGLLTLAMIPLLMLGGMDIFDSVCHAMATTSTGGFSTRNASIGWWNSTYIASVITAFMFVGGINLVLVYNTFTGKWRRTLKNDVFRNYILIITGSFVVTAIAIAGAGTTDNADGLIAAPLFHIVSAITSTGFTYSGFATWGSLPLTITLTVMFCGACAGSTTGGVKTDRITVLIKNLKSEIIYTLFPKRIERIGVGGILLKENSLIRIMGFITIYLLAITAGAIIMASYGYDITDSFFASVSCVGNNGLGYGATGTGFGSLPDPLKWIFSFEMLIGRLEIFTVLVLFYPAFWKR